MGVGSLIAKGLTSGLTGSFSSSVGSLTSGIGGDLGSSFIDGSNGWGNFARGGAIEKAMRREFIESGGRKPVLAVLNEGEYIVPANPSRTDIARLVASVPAIRRNDTIENYAKGGYLGNSINMNSNEPKNTNIITQNYVNNIYIKADNPEKYRQTEYEINRRHNQNLKRQARRFSN